MGLVLEAVEARSRWVVLLAFLIPSVIENFNKSLTHELWFSVARHENVPWFEVTMQQAETVEVVRATGDALRKKLVSVWAVGGEWVVSGR